MTKSGRFTFKILCFIMISVMLAVMCAGVAGAAELAAQPVCTDADNDMYRYDFANGAGFISTMKNGDKSVMIPFFMFDAGVSWKAYKNNAEFTYSNYDMIQEKGNFLFVITVPVSEGSEDVYKYNFSFTSVFSEDALQSEFEGLGGNVGAGASIDEFNVSDMKDILSGYREKISGQISEAGMDELDKSYYAVADTTSEYDQNKKMFGYRTSANNLVYLSQPSGIITNRPVVVEYGESVRVFAFKDDAQIENVKSGAEFSEKGIYSISFVSSADGDVDGKLGTVTFRIIDGPINDIDIFNAPKDFAIDSVKYENEDFSDNNENYCKMNIDGAYDFVVKYNKNSNVTYDVHIVRDATAPVVRISNGGLGYKVKGGAEIYSVEPDAQLRIEYEGNDVTSDGMNLERSGTYKVVVSDKAGNSRTYRLENTKKFSLSLKGVIITLVLIGAALAYLMHLSKQKVQVL